MPPPSEDGRHSGAGAEPPWRLHQTLYTFRTRTGEWAHLEQRGVFPSTGQGTVTLQIQSQEGHCSDIMKALPAGGDAPVSCCCRSTSFLLRGACPVYSSPAPLSNDATLTPCHPVTR